MLKNELVRSLQRIGLTRGESAVYLSLLKTGESKVGPIIKSSLISRSKVYDILDRLIQKGVVSKIKKNNVLYYQALSPKRLLNYLSEKEQKLSQEKEILKKAMPDLVAFLPERDIDVKVYEGIKGYKAVIDRTISELKKEDIYESMGITKVPEFMQNLALHVFHSQKEKGFKSRSIFEEQGTYRIAGLSLDRHEIKVLPKGWRTPAMFTIYADTVGIYVGEGEKIITIVIKNQDIAKSFQASFEAMWKISSKYK